MTAYAETLRQHARIAILRFLEGAPRYTSNVSILTTQLPMVGIAYTRDQVEGECHWLEEQGLAKFEQVAGFTVVSATERGAEVARGVARHPGVQRPRAGT